MVPKIPQFDAATIRCSHELLERVGFVGVELEVVLTSLGGLATGNEMLIGEERERREGGSAKRERERDVEERV